MRSIETGFRSYLDGATATSGQSVFVTAAEPGQSTDFIVIQQLSNQRFDDLGAADDSLIVENFRVTCYARTAERARIRSDAIEEALDDFTGAMGSDRVVQAVTLDNGSADFAPPEYVEGWFTNDSIVTIWHAPAA